MRLSGWESIEDGEVNPGLLNGWFKEEHLRCVYPERDFIESRK